MTGDTKRRASKVVMNLCFRIERMCRYSPLDDKEVDKRSIADRNIVEGLYYFYRKQGDNEETAARKARANAVRLVLCEAL